MYILAMQLAVVVTAVHLYQLWFYCSAGVRDVHPRSAEARVRTHRQRCAHSGYNSRPASVLVPYLNMILIMLVITLMILFLIRV